MTDRFPPIRPQSDLDRKRPTVAALVTVAAAITVFAIAAHILPKAAAQARLDAAAQQQTASQP